MIVVTGANGFIGSALVWELNRAGIEDILAVDLVDRHERPEPLHKLGFADFCSADQFLNQVESRMGRLDEIEAIFHMGACSATTETDEDFLRRNNTEYTKSLFLLATEKNIPFIYASSASVYGDGHKGFDDSLPTNTYQPLHGYGRSKANFDIWAEKQSQTPDIWYGLRFFNVYGPNEYHKGSMCSVVFKAYQQICESGRLKLFKSENPDYQDGHQMRDFVFVKDITRWMLELFQDRKVQSGIYNMGYGQARTWLDLAQAVFDSLGRPLAVDWVDMPENLIRQYQYFTEAKMQRLLNQGVSAPQWPIERGVQDYVQNYLMTGDRYL